MANKKIRATAELFLNTKDAKKDAQIFLNDLKGKLQDIETAADKMTVFKDMVAYIAQVDRALSDLRKNNKDAFNSMFDGLDVNLKQQLEGLFGVNGAQLGQVDTLREKLHTLTLKSSIKEIRTFAKEINTLFSSIGMAAPFENIDEVFSGRTSAEHLKKLGVELANFSNVWEGVNSRLSKGFGGSGGNIESSKIQQQIKSLELQLTKYRQVQEELENISKAREIFLEDDYLDESMSIEYTVEGLQKLATEFQAAKRAKEKFEESDDTSSVEYYQTLAKYSKAVLQANDAWSGAIIDDKDFIKELKGVKFGSDNLYNAINDIVDPDVEAVFDNLTDNIGAVINQAEEKISQLTSKLQSIGSGYNGNEALENTGDAVKYAGEQVDAFGKKILNVSEYVSALSGQLKEMFSATGRSANFEYHLAIDGLDIKARHGSEKSVDLATQTETYLDTLFSDFVIYGHSHRGGTAATNIQDIESILGAYRDGVAIPVHFIVGKDAITTIDFTGLSKYMVDQLMQEIAATNSNKNAPVINDTINKIVEKFTGKSSTLQTWNVDQFDNLAKYIYDVSSAASSALTPIEKFQAVLDNMFGKGKVDASKYESLLSSLNKDNVKNIFNQIASVEKLQPIKATDMLTMGQVNAEIDESIAKFKVLREEANFSYSDIRSEVDKVIEHYKSSGGALSGLDFFQQYFPEGEWQSVRNLLTGAYEGLISIEEVTNRIANEFGVDPETFAQIPTGTQGIDETSQKLREQEQLWENVKTAIKSGLGEAVGLDNTAMALEVIENEIKEGILTSLEECIARFKEFNNISDDESLHLVGERQRVIEDYYGTYLPGSDEVVSKEEADKLRQLSVQQEQLYQNLRSAIKGTLSDVVDVDDMTYVFDTIEKEIREGLLTTLDQCVERFKFLTGLDDKRLTSIGDYQRVADDWDYYRGDRFSDEVEAAERAAEAAQLRAEEAEGDALRYQEAANRLLDEKAELERENGQLTEQIKTKTDTDYKSQLVQTEIAQIEILQQKLLEVKAVIDAKTQAFEEEYVTVDSVVDAEITSLQSLITQLQEVITQINLVNDGFNDINTNVPKIEVANKSVDNGLSTENTHYVTDQQGRPVTMYRGIRNSYSGLVSNRYHGGTFSTDNLELAKEYAGELGKVEKVLLSMKNPMEIDGHGAYWNQIKYIGDNSDEASQKLHQLNATIKQTEAILEHLKTIQPTEKELKDLSRGFINETKNEREIREYTAALEKAKAERDAIFADSSNPYGKKNTNELVEIAKAKGYDGVIFKDIIDSATGSVTDLSTVMVTFEQDQIHYLETISSTFESSVAALKNHFGDLTQHIAASSEEIEASIRKMVELRGKVKTGEISEDEYNAFVSNNAIARDYEKLARKSRAVPDFITGALDGEEFELKHVIEIINGMLDNMRERMQNIAKAFGKEGVPFDELLKTSTVENSAAVVKTADAVVDTDNVADEVVQLERLQAVLAEVKNAVLSKTKAFVDEGTIVGQVVGKEVAALNKLLETINEIVPKVDALSTKMAGIGPIDFTVKHDDTNTGTTESSTTTEDKFQTRVSAKKGAMTKYINELKGVQYVTDDTREKLAGLRDALDTVKTPKDLNNIIAKFEELQTEINILKASFERTGLNDVQSAERSLLGAFNTLNIDQKLDVKPELDEVILQLETYKNAVLSGQKVELSTIEETISALRQKIEAYKEVNKEAKKTGTSMSGNASFGSTASINATAKYNSLTRAATSDQFANSSEVENALALYKNSYEQLIETRDRLRAAPAIDESDREAFKTITTECNNYAKALEKIINSSLKLKGNKANVDDYMLGADFDYSNIESRKAALADFAQQMYGVKVEATDFKDNWNKVVFAVKNGDGTFTQMTATFTDARNEIVALAGDTKKVQTAFSSFIDGFKGRVKSLSQYFLATISIYDAWRVIKQGVTYVREIDSALTELKKVTDETDESYAKFLQDMSKTGGVIGATVKDLTSSAADWARLGSIAKSAPLYSNI